MTIARTEDGIEVQWTSSSLPVEQLDAELRRDRNLTLRFGERLLAEFDVPDPSEIRQECDIKAFCAVIRLVVDCSHETDRAIFRAALQIQNGVEKR